MTQLTDWFPADVKPVHKGVYEIQHTPYRRLFAYWGGARFGWRAGFFTEAQHGRSQQDAIESAYEMRKARTMLPARDIWRGLAEKPE